MSERTGQTEASRPYKDMLADAVRVLTEAARLTRPVYETAAPDQPADLVSEASAATVGQDGAELLLDVQDVRRFVDSGRREPADFAEFVAQALVAAAANVGGVETVLAGRAGSWEADAVRQLLHGTAGYDDAFLVGYRTEPLVVEVFVDEILNDLGVWENYDAVLREIHRRADEVPADAADREQWLDAMGAEEEQLEETRQRAWAAYGAAVKEHIENAAAGRADLRVPVQVVLDLDTLRAPGEGTDGYGIGEQLLQEAIAAVSPPSFYSVG